MTVIRKPWLPVFLLVIVVAASYAGVIRNDFIVLDDQAWIVDNPHVQSGLTSEGVRWAFDTRFGGAWQPLVWISWMGVRSVWGPEAIGYHVTNVALHLLAALLLFSALRRLLGSSSSALLIAALYAVHPVQVESVAWAAERKGLLAAVFWMAAMEFYSRNVARDRWRWKVGIFLSMAVGLMAKSTLITLPFALLLLDVWPRQTLHRRQGWGAMLTEKALLLLLIPVFFVVGFQAQADFGALRETSVVERLAGVVIAYLRSLGHLFAPVDLAPLYVSPEGGFAALAAAAGAATLLTVTLIAYRQRTLIPALWIGWLWFLITLMPFSGIVAVGGHFMADRYLLIPSIGIWISLSAVLQSVFDRQTVPGRTRWIVGCVLVAALSAMTFQQVGRWKDSTTLFTHALHADPGNYLAHYWLGEARAKEADLPAAAQHFTDARTRNPNYDLAWFKEGSTKSQLHRFDEAVFALENYLRLRPHQYKGWMNLGVAHGNLGQHADALRCFEKAQEISPQDPRARAATEQARKMLSRQQGETDDRP